MRRLRLLWRRQALWLRRRRGRGIVSGDSDRRMRFTPDVAREKDACGGGAGFLAVEALVDVVTEDRVAGGVGSAGDSEAHRAETDHADLRLTRGDAVAQRLKRRAECAELLSHEVL